MSFGSSFERRAEEPPTFEVSLTQLINRVETESKGADQNPEGATKILQTLSKLPVPHSLLHEYQRCIGEFTDLSRNTTRNSAVLAILGRKVPELLRQANEDDPATVEAFLKTNLGKMVTLTEKNAGKEQRIERNAESLRTWIKNVNGIVSKRYEDGLTAVQIIQELTTVEMPFSRKECEELLPALAGQERQFMKLQNIDALAILGRTIPMLLKETRETNPQVAEAFSQTEFGKAAVKTGLWLDEHQL